MPNQLRLGTTSFIYPDHVLPNVRRLADRVSDVEILFFGVADRSGLPSDDDLHELAKIKRTCGLTYSLHTPLEVDLASGDASRRRQSVHSILDSITIAAPLDPEAFVVHVNHDASATTPAWQELAARSLRTIIDAGVPRDRLCVETLDYDFGLIEPVIMDLDVGVVLDVGHLQRDGRPMRELVRRHLARTKVIHWHGVDPASRDHRSLAHYPADEARWLIETLLASDYRGVVTLEVFGEADFEQSLAIVHQLLGQTRGVSQPWA